MSGERNHRDHKPPPDHVNLKVNGQDGAPVFFRVGRNAQLKKLMRKYCEREGLELRTIAFLLDGRPINGNQTPDQLDLQDGDEIDAMRHHGGGANAVFL